MNHIGELNERSLHAQLKAWYAKKGDRQEEKLGSYVIDIIRGDQLIEIQSGNFSSIRRKLYSLVEDHAVRLIYPIASQKWLRKLSADGDEPPEDRKSPKRGKITDVFREMVYIPGLVGHPNFELEVLLIHEREIRERKEKKRWRRKGWSTVERQLISVEDSRVFLLPEDFAALLPPDLPTEFTTSDLRNTLNISQRLAGQMAYSLREMGAIQQIGKKGKAYLYLRL